LHKRYPKCAKQFILLNYRSQKQDKELFFNYQEKRVKWKAIVCYSSNAKDNKSEAVGLIAVQYVQLEWHHG